MHLIDFCIELKIRREHVPTGVGRVQAEQHVHPRGEVAQANPSFSSYPLGHSFIVY